MVSLMKSLARSLDLLKEKCISHASLSSNRHEEYWYTHFNGTFYIDYFEEESLFIYLSLYCSRKNINSVYYNISDNMLTINSNPDCKNEEWKLFENIFDK